MLLVARYEQKEVFLLPQNDKAKKSLLCQRDEVLAKV
jgi:hypothetical protein